MKKVKYLLLLLLILLSFNVKADNKCEKEERVRLKELAKKVEFDYDYKLVNDLATFSIKAVNLNSNLKVLIIEDYYSGKYKEFEDNSNHTAILSGFKSGEKVVITIKAFVPNWCSGETVLTKTVKLPYYNYFYDEEICKDSEDFKYCKLLLESNISQKTFALEYQSYLNEKNANSNEEIISSTYNWKLLIIIGLIILTLAVLVLITIILVRRRRKNSL